MNCFLSFRFNMGLRRYSGMSIATFSTQQMLHRMDETPEEERSVTMDGARSAEAEADVTSDELMALLARLGAQIELAAERIATSRDRVGRRSNPIN